jgi:hypothetical protein
MTIAAKLWLLAGALLTLGWVWLIGSLSWWLYWTFIA